MSWKIYFNHPQIFITMRISLFLVAFLACGTFALAQGPGAERFEQMDERVKAMKAAFMTTRLDLDAATAQRFWPVYNAFESEEMAIRKKYRPEKEVSLLTDAEAEELIQNNLRMEEALLDLRKTYIGKFRDVLSVRQIALLPRVEKEFNMQMVRRLQEIRESRPQRPGQRNMRDK